MKEREGKKGKTSVEQESSGQEEPGEESLHFTDDLPREPASQEGEGHLLLNRQPIYFFSSKINSLINIPALLFVPQTMV